jgi:hypothetical protein
VVSPRSRSAWTGGERAFSTLAFVMALGASIQSPFRVIDEFDVFMVRSTQRHQSQWSLRLACLLAALHGCFARAAVRRVMPSRLEPARSESCP